MYLLMMKLVFNNETPAMPPAGKERSRPLSALFPRGGLSSSAATYGLAQLVNS